MKFFQILNYEGGYCSFDDWDDMYTIWIVIGSVVWITSTSPIIHTTTTSSYNSVPPVPAYNGPIYNQNNMYSNPNQGGMTSSVPAQNYNNNQGVPSPADYNPAAQQSNDYNHH